MDSFKIVFRGFFIKGRNQLIKIVSLSVGLALGLVLIAKVYFEQSYNDFFPEKDRIYMVMSNYSSSDGTMPFGQTAGGVAVGLKEEIPEIETATRFTWLSWSNIVTPDKNKYAAKVILGDSCLFDIFPRPVVSGNVKDVLSRPMYAMVSKKVADNMGGTGIAVGKTFQIDNRPGKTLTIGGVFEDLPANTHLDYDIVVSMNSISEFMYDGTQNWVGNDRYVSYVKLIDGIAPNDLRNGIEAVRKKYLPMEELKKAGVSIDYDFKLLSEIHAGNDETKRMTLILSLLAFALLFTAVLNYVLIIVSSLVNRSREMAVNKCYGASEKNIYFKMFSETFVDLTVSLLLALLIILFSRGVILSLLGTTLTDLFTARSIILLLVVCLFIFFIAALLPGYLYSRIPVAVAFRKFTENKRYWKLGLLFFQFIAAGFFVTLLLIIGRQYHFMLNDNPGYNYENLAYCSLSGVDTEMRQKALEEVSRLPFVAEVTTCSQLLFNVASGNNINLPNDDRELFNIADLYNVGNGYLNMMDIPVIEGRSFIENVSSSGEVMVSRSFIDKIMNYTDWSDGIVGKNILISEHSHGERLFTICGVYEDIRLGIIGNHDSRPTVMFYNNLPSSNLMIKLHQESPEAIKEVSDLLSSLLPDNTVEVYSYSAEMINKYSDAANFRDSVLIAGIATLIICLIGLLGYTNDEMNRRKRETAIRKINGARVIDIERLFVTDITFMAVPSIAMGCIIAYFIAESWLKKFADKAELPFYMFIGCGIIVLIIILSAVIINCYRAANENPAVSVKSE